MAESSEPLVVSLPTGEGLREALGVVAGVEFVDWDLIEPAPRERIDLVVPPYWGHARHLAAIGGVDARLVQWQSIGYNGIDAHLPAGVPVANAATVHEASTAELALALALAAQRDIPCLLYTSDAADD